MPTYLDELLSKYKSQNDLSNNQASFKAVTDMGSAHKDANQPAPASVNSDVVKTQSASDNISSNSKIKEKYANIFDIQKPNQEITLPKQVAKDFTKQDYLASKVQTKTIADSDTTTTEIDKTKQRLVTKYGDVEIYRVDGSALLNYVVPTPKPNPSQKLIINTLKEAATRLITTDPYKVRDPVQRQNVYYQKILDILENAPEINIPKHLYEFYAKAVVKEMVGYGILEPLLQDDKLEEIMVVGQNKPTYIYHVDYGMMTSNIIFYSEDEILEVIDKIARSLGRSIDISNPLLDARLPDGSRVNATVPPASIDGPTITIRKFRKDPYTIIDLIKFGTVNLEVASFLWCIVEGFGAKPSNLLISGGTGSGKTTLLNVLANFIPESDRILTIEDTAELNLPIKHVIRFEGRPPGIEGKGELSLDILTKNTLRMRPDRIIVGEIRHKEAATLFTAMNTGHDGCMGTVHANSARETLVRITSPPMNVPMLMLAGLDFVIVQKRLNTPKGLVRRITSIAEVTGVLDDKPQANIIFQWDPTTDSLKRTTQPIHYFETIKSYTKLSDNDIKNKIEERINTLNDMINKDIREIAGVSEIIQKGYADANTRTKG